MQSPTLSVGHLIEAHCTKCRQNTHHIIITMDEEIPTKVQCQTCNRQHKYRPPKIAKNSAELRAIHKQESERKEWKAIETGMDRAKAVDYSMTTAYQVGALINHPVFGLGCVQRITGLRKIEVLFEDGKKTMRCK